MKMESLNYSTYKKYIKLFKKSIYIYRNKYCKVLFFIYDFLFNRYFFRKIVKRKMLTCVKWNV